MKLAAPAAALSPFMDAEISVLPHTRAAEVAKAVNIPACVREASPLAAGGGVASVAAPDGWTISIRLADIPAGVEIVRGAVVLPDPAARRPRLLVNKASANGGVLHLECTALERG